MLLENKLEIIDININKIILDETNPNEMTDLQMEGLRKSMNMFGFLAPIHIDQNGNMIDGEHRYRIYKEFNKSTIPAIILNVKSKNELKLLRQTFNKLKGKHNFQKDIMEFHQIIQDYTSEQIANLMGYDKENLDYILKQETEAMEDLFVSYSDDKNKEQQQIFNELTNTTDDNEKKKNNKCPSCGFEY